MGDSDITTRALANRVFLKDLSDRLTVSRVLGPVGAAFGVDQLLTPSEDPIAYGFGLVAGVLGLGVSVDYLIDAYRMTMEYVQDPVGYMQKYHNTTILGNLPVFSPPDPAQDPRL